MLFRSQLKWLAEKGGLTSVCDGKVLVLMPEYYGETGVLTQQMEQAYLEVNS